MLNKTEKLNVQNEALPEITSEDFVREVPRLAQSTSTQSLMMNSNANHKQPPAPQFNGSASLRARIVANLGAGHRCQASLQEVARFLANQETVLSH